MVVGEFRLEIRPLIPIKTEPFEAVEDTLDRTLGGTFLVGVFDAQNKFPAIFACI